MRDERATTRRAFLAGASAAGLVAASSTVRAQEGTTVGGEGGTTGTPAGTRAGGQTGTPGGAQGGATHTVDMTDELVFDPDSLTVAPGDTVVWENVGQAGHSVTAYEDEIPDGAEYFASGGAESESAARSGYPQQGNLAAGDTFEHTFEVEGEYGYFCIPHEGVGMVGSVSVAPGGGGGEPSGPSVPTVPESARIIGIAASVGLLSILGLTYVFLKYGGGPREE